MSNLPKEMSNLKHTPLPWTATTQQDGHYIHGNTPLGVNSVARVYPRHYGVDEEMQMNQEDKANAELIVKAVNCHEELVEALEKLVFKYEFNLNATQKKNIEMDEEYQTALNAIKKATTNV